MASSSSTRRLILQAAEVHRCCMRCAARAQAQLQAPPRQVSAVESLELIRCLLRVVREARNGQQPLLLQHHLVTTCQACAGLANSAGLTASWVH